MLNRYYWISALCPGVMLCVAVVIRCVTFFLPCFCCSRPGWKTRQKRYVCQLSSPCKLSVQRTCFCPSPGSCFLSESFFFPFGIIFFPSVDQLEHSEDSFCQWTTIRPNKWLKRLDGTLGVGVQCPLLLRGCSNIMHCFCCLGKARVHRCLCL